MKIKNNQSGIAHIGMVILIVAVVGAIGFGGYRIYSSQDDSSSNGSTSVNKEDSTSSDFAVRELKAEMEAFLERENATGSYKTTDIESDKYITYKVDGYSYISGANTAEGFGLAYTGNETGPEAYDASQAFSTKANQQATSILTEAGFTELEAREALGPDGGTEFTYEKDGYICQFTTSAADYSCSSTEAIKQVALESKPFVDLYESAKESASDKVVNKPAIEQGANGYTVARMGVHYERAKFYQNDGVWIFVESSSPQDAPDCNPFESDADASRAFEGGSCFDESTKEYREIIKQ